MSSLSDGCFVDVNMLGVGSDEASRLQHIRHPVPCMRGTAYPCMQWACTRGSNVGCALFSVHFRWHTLLPSIAHHPIYYLCFVAVVFAHFTAREKRAWQLEGRQWRTSTSGRHFPTCSLPDATPWLPTTMESSTYLVSSFKLCTRVRFLCCFHICGLATT